MWDYTCPNCGGDVVAERFECEPVQCPACGRWFETEHDCYYDGECETCVDYLVPLTPLLDVGSSKKT